ncbi:glycosyltransferase family 4 protein [Halocola ammonii]
MKIALLTDGIYPWVMGGMQKHSYHLARYLARSGVKVSLFHCVGENDPIPFQSGADPKFFNKKELENIDFWCARWPGRQDSLPGHYLRENRRYSQFIWQEIQQRPRKYDLIYAQGFTGWRCLKARKAGELDTPILVNFHGLEMFQKAPSFRVKLEHLSLRSATKWNLKNADYVSSFGGKIKEILENLRIDRKKIIEIPNGIEERWVENQAQVNSDGIRRFIFIGRYERRKGIEELHAALRQLVRDQSLKFEFHFVGPIPNKKQLQEKRIIYHGLIRESEKVEAILRECDVLVCPSHSEGMPTVILEAMAKGLAILATDVGAISQLISNNGWLIGSIEPVYLKDELERIIGLKQENLTEKKINSLNEVRERFLWEKVATTTISKVQNKLA